jgi:phosphoribosyl-AMP cyclohydrolase
MDRIEVVSGLDPSIVERVVTRIRELEPSALAILVSGSYTTGTADEDSDLDLQVATEDEPRVRYRMWFEERPGAKPLHVSLSVKSVAEWLATRAEPQSWALGFAVEHIVSYVWASPGTRVLLGDPPSNRHPPEEPQLADFVEYVAKVRRAATRGDAMEARMYARQGAELAPGLLRTLNPEVLVRDRSDALAAALSLEVSPEHFRDDLPVCLGVVQASDDQVFAACQRLAHELLAVLRERAPEVDPQPDIARYLADGTLERQLGFL